MSARGLIIAAPASGSGKTTLTLGLLRALRQRGIRVGSAKVGPDYIDPAFHAAASGRPCRTLDPWAMRPRTLLAEGGLAASGVDLVVVEGVMGLFDGAVDGTGSTADLAARLGWPVVLVLDVSGQGASAAAVAAGFAAYRADVTVAGVILNRVGSDRHYRLVEAGLARTGLSLLGGVGRTPALDLPSRHLGLVQAAEHPDLAAFLDQAARLVAAGIDLDRVIALAQPLTGATDPVVPIPPPGQRVAVAQDAAFAFLYPHLIEGWQRAGAAITFFSPLADQGPAPGVDAVYLPGGYPELHAGRLAGALGFHQGMAAAAARGAVIYGECGGYMVLGQSLTDGNNVTHRMLGLLPHRTSIAEPRRHLGYRQFDLVAGGWFGPAGTGFRGHEFHYASDTDLTAPPLFILGGTGTPVGQRLGAVGGSFLHLIDRVDPGGSR